MNLDVAESMDKLGRTCRLLRDLETADRMLTGALDIRRQLIKGEDPYFATNTNSLGILKRHRGKYLEAEALLVESAIRYRQAFGQENENIPLVMKNLGLVYIDMDRPADAAELMRAALPLVLAAKGEQHGDTASIRLNLATALERLCEYSEAEAHLERAGETWFALYGDRNANLALVHERRAAVCRSTGRPAEAERWLDRALEIHREIGNQGEVVRCLGKRAELLRSMQRPADEEAALREALCIACEMDGASRETIGIQQAALAVVLVDQGQLDEAEGLLRTAEPVLTALSTEERAGAARETLARIGDQRGRVASEAPTR